jgi:CRP-like cAMP-binding protein
LGKLRDIAATIRAGHIDIIRHLPLFEGLPEEALTDISQKLTGDSIEQDEVVFEKGSPANSLYVITRGWFKIVTVDGQGEELILNQVGPGEAIGEMSLIDAEPRSASFIAMTPGEVVRLQREDFLEVLARSPYLAQHMLKKMSARMRFSTTYIEQAIEFARSIAEGDYNFVMNQIQSTQSTIGEKERSDQARANELLTAFFKMVEGVREREEALQQQVRQLTIQIDQSKRKEEFESVTKSEFYQDLKTKAAQLRENSSKDEE